MAHNFMEFAFTEPVRKEQESYGTRAAYERMEKKEAFRNTLTWQEKSYIKGRDSFYVASVGENGWPYMQYRGGPKGFLKVLNENRLAYADFRGNGQYISAGNLKASKKAVLFLMDYTRQQRLKIWVEAQVLGGREVPDLLEKVISPDYDAIVERIIVFQVLAFDWNCPQHITPRFTLEEMQGAGPPSKDPVKGSLQEI
ncbi:MAG: pyridoxamine 5-phosphate oxidase [Candidatus Nitronauta litoralis]|uniref:Pyridoxamine 5-phosphate oxidase n=1 Tax=Candidatus Nitronauta litoralis TaxID=2705533 RepID=A0A7T0G0Z9_9BACT|nr:MAG: pyridoxamine 5-phosphate oxidase [Candidatus Nitronauta litoralis]